MALFLAHQWLAWRVPQGRLPRRWWPVLEGSLALLAALSGAMLARW